MQIGRDPDILDANIRVFNYRNLRRVDWVFVILTLLLATVGLLTQYSASHGAASVLGSAEKDRSLFRSVLGFFSGYSGRQAMYFVAGSILAALILCIDYRFLVSLAPAMYLGILVLLVAVLWFGYEAKGAQRWLDLWLFKLQPSEFSKIVLIYTLAWYISRLGPRIRKPGYFALAFVLAGVPCVLVFLQPSLSAALALLPVVFVVVYVAGCRLWHVTALVLAGLLPATLVGIQVWDYQELGPQAYEAKHYPLDLKLREHQVKRILTFLDPEQKPEKEGYQAIQTRITVGSGELTGKGFCKGTQTHLSFLPEYHTDLVFALLGEEWGFVGAIAVLALYLAFVMRALFLAQACTDPAGSILAIGCATLLAFHAFTNIAITVGLLPVTGIPLPFLTYGGSFYITTMMCVGTLLSIHVRKRFFE